MKFPYVIRYRNISLFGSSRTRYRSFRTTDELEAFIKKLDRLGVSYQVYTG